MSDCIIDLKNLGLSKCNKLPGQPKGMITTPLGFSISVADAADPTKWQDALLAEKDARIYLWPDFRNSTDNSEKAVYEITPLSSMKIRDGQPRFLFEIKESLCVHKAMKSHSEVPQRVFVFDNQNQIIATVDSAGKLRGFTVDLLNVENLMWSNGQVSTKSPVYVSLKDPDELNVNGTIIDGSFVGALNRLTDVAITITSAAIGKIVATVKATCDGTLISGLALADFVVKTAAGAVIVPSTMTENAGIYTLNSAANAFLTGTLGLKTPDLLTIEAYEAPTIVLTVPFP